LIEFVFKGNKNFLQKKYTEAIYCYNQALKQNGEKAIYYINRALCYIKLKQWDKVYQDVRHSLELDPNYIKAHAYLGQYYIEQQRYDEAILSLKHALELCKIQNKNYGDEIPRLLRYAQKQRFSLMEQKRIENEISLQTYLRSLIEADKERRIQSLSETIDHHSPRVSTDLTSSNSQLTTMMNHQSDIAVEQALWDIEQSTDQSLNEMNNLFNEVDIRRKRREIPEYLTCKLCYDLMRDPVITPCKFLYLTSYFFHFLYLVGITYCRSCIEENLYKVSHLDPIANKPLVVDQLINNLVVKEIVEKFIKENEWVNSEYF
jgi:STIP1 family protein 1